MEMLSGQAQRRETALHTESKPRRADALRNEAKIVEAALTQFSKRGVEASLDGIARQAGVGPGTLYRHFPTRNELIASALGECRVELQALRESLTETEDALSALRKWLRMVRDYVKTFKGLAVLLLHAVNEQTSPLSPICVEMQNITAHFLQRAQQAGAARPNIGAKDLFVAQLALACVEDIAADSSTGAESLEYLLREGYVVPGLTP
jgi:AcrR family transcriptional regulator